MNERSEPRAREQDWTIVSLMCGIIDSDSSCKCQKHLMPLAKYINDRERRMNYERSLRVVICRGSRVGESTVDRTDAVFVQTSKKQVTLTSQVARVKVMRYWWMLTSVVWTTIALLWVGDDENGRGYQRDGVKKPRILLLGGLFVDIRRVLCRPRSTLELTEKRVQLSPVSIVLRKFAMLSRRNVLILLLVK